MTDNEHIHIKATKTWAAPGKATVEHIDSKVPGAVYLMSQFQLVAEHVESFLEARLAGRERRTCTCCKKRRLCGRCIMECGEFCCSECSRKTKDGDDTWICNGCYEEAVDYARYGIWGPP